MPENLRRVIYLLAVCLLLTAGCEEQFSSFNLNFGNAKFERTDQLQASLPAGSTLEVTTGIGSITVKGEDIENCQITAKIVTHAGNEQQAKKIADNVRVTLELLADKAIIGVSKPSMLSGKAVRVSFDIKVPIKTNLILTTTNGSYNLDNIYADVKGTTQSGEIFAGNIFGKIDLSSYNGSIVCKNIAGDTNLSTYNGSIRAIYSDQASPISSFTAKTHNGGIDFKSPPKFSAAVDVSTTNGSINSTLPITVKEAKTKSLIGTIGAGQGKLVLHTFNGSIKIE